MPSPMPNPIPSPVKPNVEPKVHNAPIQQPDEEVWDCYSILSKIMKKKGCKSLEDLFIYLGKGQNQVRKEKEKVRKKGFKTGRFQEDL